MTMTPLATVRGIQSAARSIRSTARGRAMAVLVALLLAGASLSVANVQLASSAANAVTVLHSGTVVDVNPMSPQWEKAEEASIPLSSQQIQQPGGGSTRMVRVKAIEDGHTVAFRVSWDDDTKNDASGSTPTDAAAIQLPTDPTHLPYACMGQSTNRVNIWQWKAALEKEGLENLGALPVENAGVRNLSSNGICKAVDIEGLAPQVKSFHDGKQWHVVFYRKLAPGDEGVAPLVRTSNSSIAFAVWNGARNEVRGMKAVSTWNTLMFQTPEQGNAGNLVGLAVIVALSAGLVAWAMRRFAG